MKKLTLVMLAVLGLVAAQGAYAGMLELTASGGGTYVYDNALDSDDDRLELAGDWDTYGFGGANMEYVSGNSGVGLRGGSGYGWFQLELVLPGGLAFDTLDIQMNATTYEGATAYTNVNFQTGWVYSGGTTWSGGDAVSSGPGGTNYVQTLLQDTTTGISETEDCYQVSVYVVMRPREINNPEYATINDILITGTAVPEPVTLCLLACGAIAGLFRRRRS